MPMRTAGEILGAGLRNLPVQRRAGVLVQALRQYRRWALTAAGALALAGALSGAALAQGKLEARYSASLAGIPIGTGSWVIDIGDTHYTAAASGATAGLLRVFTSGHGTSAATGTTNGAGKLLSSVYAATISTRKSSDEIRLSIAGGTVKEFKLDPPADHDPERLPITDAHRHGVTDPMSAMLLRMPGHNDPLKPEACERTLPIFDGRLRYDLKLAYKRMDHVKAEKGYAGPVVVCAVYFSPIAGFIPSRSAIRYITKLRDMKIWFAPMAGTRVLVPFRAQGPTPIGRAVLEARQFVANRSRRGLRSTVPRRSDRGARHSIRAPYGGVRR